MSVPSVSSSWDLTPAISLLHSFSLEDHHERHSSPDQTVKGPVDQSTLAPADVATVGSEGHPTLGDFDALFAFLSQASPPELGVAISGTDHGKVSGQIGGNKNVLERATLLKHQLELKEPQIGRILLKQDVTKNTKPHQSAASELPVSTNATVLLQPKSILRRPIPAPITVPTVVTAPKGKRIVGSTIHVEALLTGTTLQRQHALVSLLIEKHAKIRHNLQLENLREYLCYPLKTVPAGIHVFVDMSNIMIGFHDCIKTSRDIDVTARVRRLPLSFQNFSLVLERARPVNKRVLVGSDRYPAIDEAEKLGYEANILERVYKAKTSSPRKKTKFFGGGPGNSGGNGVYDQSSSSETNARHPVERWVEQAVDEILHLKILESIVDTDAPSTIVLATGDAAQAEYSDGFLKMVERALSKGWFVELVSFSSTTSRAYTRKAFRDKWGSRFRIFELDIYAEYLLDL
ncbi:hypothetical protein FQN49_006602 [Arthroderma sp. PD_2]|nr:hypothetical protein FQN49_006602 [Arthroderma sp. PD_2]